MSEAQRPARLPAAARRALIEEAACRCLARGGFRDFTVDKIIAEAGVSRGLILHHFGSMEGLLLAVYDRMYDEWIDVIGKAQTLDEIIGHLVEGDLFGRDASRIWIALWDLIPGHPVLHAAHWARFKEYHARLTAVLATAAVRSKREVDAETLASGLICLIDGIGLQRGLDADLMPAERAEAICRAYLELCIGSSPASGPA